MPVLLRDSLVIAVLLALTGGARADFCPVPADQTTSPIQALADSRSVAPTTSLAGLEAPATPKCWDTNLLEPGCGGDVLGEALARETKPAVHQMPAAPSSAYLFLSAMLSVGAWHLVCSARNLHWGALPEWYHTGGPLQVGHSIPLDLDFHAMLPCRFEQTVGERAFHYRPQRDECPRCGAQSFIIIAAPRGPPRGSF